MHTLPPETNLVELAVYRKFKLLAKKHGYEFSAEQVSKCVQIYKHLELPPFLRYYKTKEERKK